MDNNNSKFTAQKNIDALSIFEFDAIRTHWEIISIDNLDHLLKQNILERIDQFDRTYSRFRPDSLVSTMSRGSHGGSFTFPEDAVELFDLYDQLHFLTDGAVDPLVGRNLELLEYDSSYSLKPKSDLAHMNHYRHNWAIDIFRTGPLIRTHQALVVDLGAISKGYLVDIVSNIISDAGYKEFIVDGSGDMRHSGAESVSIGLEHPLDKDRVIGVYNLHNKSLCASATNRRTWRENIHHVIDPKTGQPTRDVIATWVVGATTAIADGLATALFFTNGEQLQKAFDFSYIRMFSNGSVEVSSNFEREIFF